MKKRILSIINEVLELEEKIINEIGIDDDLTTYGMDSINAIEVVVLLEMEFEICIEEEDLFLENLLTISKIEDIISKYLIV